MSESTAHKLSRIRPPRVQITYDVETNGEVQQRELPLVVGIMSDLSGKSEVEKAKLKERKFVEIDRDNFNNVMESIAPRVSFTVDNQITGEGKLPVDLTFADIDDFSPLEIVKNVPALKKLYEARSHLVDLLGKLDGNDKLDEMLQDIINNTPGLEEIKAATQKEDGAEIETETTDEEEN